MSLQSRSFRTQSALALALLFAGLLATIGGLPRAASASTAAAPSRKTIYLPLVRKAPPQPAAISFFGMNLYLTKVERRGTRDNLPMLADLAKQAGVRWTREELVWSLIEPNQNDLRPIYDSSLRLAAQKEFGIIGMLLTTPA